MFQGLSLLFFLKSFKGNAVFLEVSSVLFYEESLLISLEGFCFAFILRNMFKPWMRIVFRIYYSYLADSLSLISPRSSEFVGNLLLNFFKGDGDKE